jgi:methylated-DNA-[protein]-cysteine S-methyltransferase
MGGVSPVKAGAGAVSGGMSRAGFAFFDTAIGRCGLAWGPEGLTGVRLPPVRAFPGLEPAEPPPAAARAIARITAFLAGAADDFLDVELDSTKLGAFDRAVYDLARAIPAGTTRTYGALAAALGDPGQARAVGQSLGRNPWPILVPCHRITAADGRTGGFSAPGGVATKLKLLEIEGALAVESLPLFGGQG